MGCTFFTSFWCNSCNFQCFILGWPTGSRPFNYCSASHSKIVWDRIWQSQVENSVAYFDVYFDRVTAFEVWYLWTSAKGGAQTWCVTAATIDTTTHRVWAPPLNGSSELRQSRVVLLVSSWRVHVSFASEKERQNLDFRVRWVCSGDRRPRPLLELRPVRTSTSNYTLKMNLNPHSQLARSGVIHHACT